MSENQPKGKPVVEETKPYRPGQVFLSDNDFRRLTTGKTLAPVTQLKDGKIKER